jgi:hypothetical protein
MVSRGVACGVAAAPASGFGSSGDGAGRSPSRSSASRNPMPSFLRRKSMTSPDARQPKQKKLFVAGYTTRLGCSSSWKGQPPT